MLDAIPLNIPGELRIMLSDGKALAQVTLSLAASPRFHYLTLYGTKGTLRVDLLNKWLVLSVHVSGLPRAISRLVMNIRESWIIFFGTIRNVINVLRKKFLAVDGIPVLIRRFYEAIQTGSTCPLPPEQGLVTM